MTAWDDSMTDLANAEIDAFQSAIRYYRIAGRTLTAATGAITELVEIDGDGNTYVSCDANAGPVTVDMYSDAKINVRDFTFRASDVSNPKAGDRIVLVRDLSSWRVVTVESILEGQSWKVHTKRHVAAPAS
jgi:hypothetical protein